MKKTLKKALAFVLALTMVFSSLIVMNPVSAQEATSYTIYPTPQEMIYDDGEFVISDDVNVVYGDAIDSYTKDHAVDVLGILNKTNTVGDAVDESKTKITL